ncbi:DUF2059 domain-containing protein [Formosa sediminum]|uniref:DUF2059 domain-containing protein n=1 Tax=Formosa sediminum TaxID=2594004 RepID=A0A516GLY5_9FLAO|nr:DUF2059 domain-containing protein [Formosa sediminum]QDO92539.1 DUF2059 domain-containing protein [Formosa sediminum]
MKFLFTLCIGLLLSISVYSQTEEYTKAATQCLNITGMSAHYETIFETCFKQMQDQYAKLNIPSNTWKEFKTVKPEALARVNQELVTVYSDFFTLEDVQKMNALYRSSTGQTMIKNPNALTKKDKKEIDRFYKSETGKKIINSQSAMNQKMQVVSDFWCGEMYKDVNEKLEAKGYTIR